MTLSLWEPFGLPGRLLGGVLFDVEIIIYYLVQDVNMQSCTRIYSFFCKSCTRFSIAKK